MQMSAQKIKRKANAMEERRKREERFVFFKSKDSLGGNRVRPRGWRVGLSCRGKKGT